MRRGQRRRASDSLEQGRGRRFLRSDQAGQERQQGG
jgi:hypothetical protein